MTTVVPTSEEDPVLSVVRFTAEMSWAEAGPEVAEQQVSSLCLEAQELMIAGRWLDLASLMITSAHLLFNKASDKDLECIFTIICDLVKKPESLDELLEMAKLLSAKIAQQPNDKPGLIRTNLALSESYSLWSSFPDVTCNRPRSKRSLVKPVKVDELPKNNINLINMLCTWVGISRFFSK